MTTSISSEAFENKPTENQRMKDNTVNKKIISGKTDRTTQKNIYRIDAHM